MSFWKWLKPIKTIDELVARKKTLNECLWWVENQIDYREIGSTFPSVEEVLKEMITNCKGFSVVTAALLRHFSFFPYIICYAWEGINGKDLHHSIVVYQNGSAWRYVSLGSPHTISPAPASLVGAVKAIEPNVYYAQEVKDDGSYLQTLVTRANEGSCGAC